MDNGTHELWNKLTGKSRSLILLKISKMAPHYIPQLLHAELPKCACSISYCVTKDIIQILSEYIDFTFS